MVQAGLVITERMARRLARRILVVSLACPLLEQWKHEIAQRFGLRLEVIDRGRPETEVLAERCLQGWQHPSEHQKHRLDPAVTATGVGVAQREPSSPSDAGQRSGPPTSQPIALQMMLEEAPSLSLLAGYVGPLGL